MNNELTILSITAASIGFIHTVIGPDHYLPFIVMGRAARWSLTKTIIITFLSGIGHILSSVLLGFIGIAFGIAVTKLEVVESHRAGAAAWALVIFGLVYFIWGLRKVFRKNTHEHLHIHAEEDQHTHTHHHLGDHIHIHSDQKTNLTPWILFTIFVFGPCEPLIPVLMYPAAKNSLFGLVLVISIFGITTILTMTGLVVIASLGISLIPLGKLERYSHALAGATIFLCGLAIHFLGL